MIDLLPGRVWKMGDDMYLLLAVRTGRVPKALKGFEGKLATGQAALALMVDGDWHQLGEHRTVNIDDLIGPRATYTYQKRAARPIAFMPGHAPTVRQRRAKSDAQKASAGAKKKTWLLGPLALAALAIVREKWESQAGPLDEVDIINALLVLEADRIERGEPSPYLDPAQGS